MKSIRMIAFLIVALIAVQLLAGCSGDVTINTEPDGKFTHFVDVYLKQTAIFGNLMEDEAGEDLWLFPGDILIVNNITDQEATVSFPEGLCKVLGEGLPEIKDGKATITIKPGRRAMLMMIKKVTDDDAFDVKVGTFTTTGSPKVKIGDGP